MKNFLNSFLLCGILTWTIFASIAQKINPFNWDFYVVLVWIFIWLASCSITLFLIYVEEK